MMLEQTFSCVQCSTGSATLGLDTKNSYATDGATQHARSSISRPHQHFQTLVSAFDGDDHDCSGTLSDSALQRSDQRVRPSASPVDQWGHVLLHGKQQISQELSDGAVQAQAMFSPAPSSSDGGSQWSASQWSGTSGSEQSLASMASVDTVIAEGVALEMSNYPVSGDFLEGYNYEIDEESYGRGVVSRMLFSFAKRALGWCVHENQKSLGHVSRGSNNGRSRERGHERRARKHSRRSLGAHAKRSDSRHRSQKDKRLAKASGAISWELESLASGEHVLLQPLVTGTLSEPAWRIEKLLSTMEMPKMR